MGRARDNKREPLEIQPHKTGRPRIEIDDDGLQLIAHCAELLMPDHRIVATLNAAGYDISPRTFRVRKHEGSEDDPSPVMAALQQGKACAAETRGDGFLTALARGDMQAVKHYDAVYDKINPSQRIDAVVDTLTEDQAVDRIGSILEMAKARQQQGDSDDRSPTNDID